MDIKERIINCVQKIGLDCSNENFINADNISSVEFIYLIIELEGEFSIDFPNYYLSFEILESLDYLAKIITELLKQTEDSIHEV